MASQSNRLVLRQNLKSNARAKIAMKKGCFHAVVKLIVRWFLPPFMESCLDVMVGHAQAHEVPGIDGIGHFTTLMASVARVSGGDWRRDRRIAT